MLRKKREMELVRELRMCRARLAAQGGMMMCVVKVEQETKDAKSAAKAQLKDAQQALVHATATGAPSSRHSMRR
jgi:hypothetical protein